MEKLGMVPVGGGSLSLGESDQPCLPKALPSAGNRTTKL